MINKQKIRKLAQMAASEKVIPADIEKFVLEYLGKQDLKTFLTFYKNALQKKRVFVSAASEISKDSLKALRDQYKGKEVIELTDSTLGAGIKIVEDDMVVDFTFKKYINDTVEKLKN